MTKKTKKFWEVICYVVCTVCIVINLVIAWPRIKADYAEYKSPYYEKLDNGFTTWKDVDKLMHISCKSKNGERISYFVHMPDSFYMQPHEYQLKIAESINKSFKDYAKTNSVYVKDKKVNAAFGWVYITPAEHYDFIVYNVIKDYKDIDYVTATYKYYTKENEHTMYTQQYAHDPKYTAKLDSISKLNTN